MKYSILYLFLWTAYLCVINLLTVKAISCANQEDRFKSIIQNGRAVNVFYFMNDTKETIQLTWAGENSGVLILVTMTEGKSVPGMASDIYRSANNGKTFTNITNLFGERVYIRRDNGLQRHHHQRDSKELFVICFNKTETRHSIIFVTEDGGITWEKSNVPFVLNGLLRFYPRKRLSPWILTLEESTSILFLSTDNGKTWTKIHENVVDYFWSIYEVDAVETFYILHRPDGASKNNSSQILLKSSNFGQTWTKLMDRVLRVWAPRGLYNQWPTAPNGASYRSAGENSRHSSFLYVAHTVTDKAGNETTRLSVSTNGGHHFRPVYLPDVQPERFFSVLEVEDDSAFIHVDAPNDTGFGTLYTSDSTGRVFSESLRHHLFPNHAPVTDFYRVTSMRGTYLATRLNPDRTLHTVISHDRGASWRPLGPPVNTPGACKTEAPSSASSTDQVNEITTTVPQGEKRLSTGIEHPDNVRHESVTGETWENANRSANSSKDLSSVKVCGLQISNQFSIRNHVVASPPMTIPAAPGLILVHGHVGTHLKNTPADVFVSSDGGYTWRKALEGPHHYHIANRGGLIVAVPAHTLWPDTLKFSTDEGYCWHSVPLRKSETGQAKQASLGAMAAGGNSTASLEVTEHPLLTSVSHLGGGRIENSSSKVESKRDISQTGNTVDANEHSQSGPRTDESVVFTGLVTEPGGRAMAVAVYGYGTVSQRWRVAVVDFQANGMVQRICNQDDYELWAPHSSTEGETDGCLLGMKETYNRLKKESLCENEYGLDPMMTATPCLCTQADFECEYGYHREIGSLNCVFNPHIVVPEEICQLFDEDAGQLHNMGYRKVPGNRCVGGWQPPPLNDTILTLVKKCHGAENTNASVSSHLSTVVLTIFSLLMIVFMIAVLFRIQRRRQRQNSTFSFSNLNNGDNMEAGSRNFKWLRGLFGQVETWKQNSAHSRISFQHSDSQSALWPQNSSPKSNRVDQTCIKSGFFPSRKVNGLQTVEAKASPKDSSSSSTDRRPGPFVHVKSSFGSLIRNDPRGYHHLKTSRYLEEANLLETEDLDCPTESIDVTNTLYSKRSPSDVQDPLTGSPCQL